MSVRRATSSALVLALLVLSGCGGEEKTTQTTSPPPVKLVAGQLEEAGAESVIVYVADGDREHAATGGSRRPGTSQRFRVGSVTKTFTATIVLQLVAEGRLRLADTIDDHLPGLIPRGEEITIRQLLEHRSGLVNFTDYGAWLERAGRSSSTRPIDTVRFAASHELLFPPGSELRYSNTNYIALGLVVEKVAGRAYEQELRERILEPLELDRTEVPTTRRVPDLDDDGENPQVPWAAGAIVSDVRDLARFYSALLGGRVLSPQSLAQMKRTVVIQADRLEGGLGIFAVTWPCGRFWGHDGAILDYETTVLASDDGHRVAVMSFRGDTSGALPDPAVLFCPAE